MCVDFYYKLISIKIFIKYNLVDDLFFYLPLDKSFSAMLFFLYIYFLVYYHCLLFKYDSNKIILFSRLKL
jgi:hypothetical protein